MANLIDLATIAPIEIWGDAVRARAVQGERITFAVVELAPGAVVPEHRHEAEQVGIVIEGTVTFTLEDETRELGPGGMWRIPSNAAHTVTAGPAGAVVIDTFNPTRDDWAAFRVVPPGPPVWPR